MAIGKPKYDVFLGTTREEDEGGGLDWQASVLDKDLNDPPGAPSLGDRYIVAVGGINAWIGHDTEIAEWNGVSWDFFVPDEGCAAWVEDENKTYVFNGSAWVTMGSTMLHSNLQGLAAPADDHTQYMLRTMLDGPMSPMILTGAALSAGAGVGTLKVGVLTALLRDDVLETDELKPVSLAEQDNIAIPGAETEYKVVLKYNGGAPLIAIQLAAGNGTTEIGIGHCLKDVANNVHFCKAGMRLSNGLAKLHKRAAALRHCELADGCAIGDDTLQRFSIQPGVIYHGITKLLPFLAGAYHSLADKFEYIYGDSVSGWTYVANQTDIDNLHYYDGAGGLAELTNNTKYACHWVYTHADDGDVFVVYGTCNGALAEAEQAQPPNDLPPRLNGFATLLGCIIIKKNDTSFTTIQMVTDRFFTGSAVADHGSVAGLDDDDHLQYLLHDGSRAMTGDLDMGSKNIDSAIDVNAERHNIPTKKVDCRVLTDAGVNAALAELGAGGGEVYLPEGTYLCTGSITIPVANVTLRGAGKGTILDASAGHTFTIVNCAQADCVIANIQFKGQAGGTHSSLSISGDRCTVRGCYFYQAGAFCLSLTGEYADIAGNVFYDADEACIKIENGLNGRIRGNHFRGGYFGVHASTAAMVLIEGNQFYDTDTDAIYLACANNVVIGNFIYTPGGEGIRCTAAGQVIIGNFINQPDDAQDDIYLNAAAGCVVVNNRCTSAAGKSERAVNLINSPNCVIQGNYSIGHDTCGLELDVNSIDCSIGSNKFRDATPIIDAASGHVYQLNSDLNMGGKAIVNAGNVGAAEGHFTGEVSIKVYTQAGEPTLAADNNLALWIDSDDSNRTYLVFRRGVGDQVLVELG